MRMPWCGWNVTLLSYVYQMEAAFDIDLCAHICEVFTWQWFLVKKSCNPGLCPDYAFMVMFSLKPSYAMLVYAQLPAKVSPWMDTRILLSSVHGVWNYQSSGPQCSQLCRIRIIFRAVAVSLDAEWFLLPRFRHRHVTSYCWFSVGTWLISEKSRIYGTELGEDCKRFQVLHWRMLSMKWKVKELLWPNTALNWS